MCLKNFTLAFLLTLCYNLSFAQSTHTVCSSGCHYSTISSAVSNVNVADGDILSIMDAVHTEGDIVVSKELTIESGLPNGSIVQAHAVAGSATQKVMEITADVILNNLTIQHGKDVDGGGIFINQAVLKITNCTVNSNEATNFGGGIHNDRGTLNMTNCTVTGNNSAGGQGGGIFNTSGVLNIMNSTIAINNSASLGGGIANFSGTMHFTNTILADNTSPFGFDNIFGTANTSFNSICEGCSGTWTSTDDPKLGILSDNGGATETIAIVDNCSAAINGGTSTGAPAMDQTGSARQGVLDIGAVEYQGSLVGANDIPRPGAGYSLEFNGTSNYVSMAEVPLMNGLTYTAWIKTTSTDATSGFAGNSALTIIGDNTNNIMNSFGVHGGKVQYSHNTGTWNTVVSTSNVNDGKWYHVAVTHEQATGTVSLYVNGVLEATSTLAYAAANVGYNRVGGSYVDGTNTADLFDGELDDVVVFGSVLTETEIREWMCKKLNPSHPKFCEIETYYRFNESSGNITRDFMISNDGTLVNSPVYKVSGAPVGDDSKFSYSVANGTSITLAHANGDQMTVNVTNAGGADAIQIYRIDEAANVVAPPVGLAEVSLTNHWGVKTFGGTGTVYEVVYNYNGHPGILNEAELKLASRASNAATSWIETAAVLDEVNNTLTLGGQTGTQFVLASKTSNSLPVDLTTFYGLQKEEQVNLYWITATEVQNRGFEVQHSVDGSSWKNLGFVDGAGNSNSPNNYVFVHDKPEEGDNYYRLEQFDFDGQSEFSQTILISYKPGASSPVTVFPNPVKANLNISNFEGTGMVYNAAGQKIMEFSAQGDSLHTLNFSRFNKGVYYMILVDTNGNTTKKKIVK